jgi:plastocyanin
MAARRVVVPLVAAALLAAGCGGDDNGEATDTTPVAEGTTLQLVADPGGALAFDETSLDAPAGSITIELTNDSSVPHNVAVENGDVDEESDTVTGEPTSLTVDLESGAYTFYCSVPGHRDAGMEGTLNVS